ncbi:hypothetical protein HOLleu_13706 [Holothuria leucospilota]|uniref:Peptidase aspartic putative domain-containing protein n=1 Tax=Holothuria leucospilota TaxID=206669 RepID=A0A9Q1HB63_HOLLE|nr:hypothetical protein HOLleu_13706 [Holothuria leucospilota]
MEKLKIKRRNRKGNLTRGIKELECLLANGATVENIRKVIAKAQLRFESIEQCHNETVELIEKDEDYEREQAWITECQQEYMTEMIRVEKLLAERLESQTKPTEDVNQVSSNEVNRIEENNNESGEESDANSNDGEAEVNVVEDTNDRKATSENGNNGACGFSGNASSSDNKVSDDFLGFFKTLSLPKPQIKQFDGEPLHYHAFMSTYMNMVANVVDDNVKLNTLMSLCVGKALESIKYCVLKTPSVGCKAAIETLKYRFGNTAVVVQAWINKILSCPKVDPGKMTEYADDLNNCFEALSALGYLHELNNRSSLKQIVDKLPKFLQNRWKRENYRLKMTGVIPGLENIVKFVKASAMEINDPVFGNHENWSAPSPRVKFNKNQVNSTCISVTQQGDRRFPKCWLCKSDQHWPDQCETLKSMEVEARLEAAKNIHACFSCLKVAGRNHRMNNCSRKRVCGIRDGSVECQKTHNRLLHCIKKIVANQSILKGFKDPLLSVLDVEVMSKYGNVLAKVMLDSRSQGTFIREDFVKEIDIKGRQVSACITKVGGTTENFESQIYDISLRGIQSGMLHEIKALGLKTINKVENVDTKKLETMFHMKPGTLHRRGGDIDILIGVDNAKLLTGKTVELGGLIAQNSPLGWTVFGGCNNDQVHSSIMHVKICKTIDLTDFWSTEAMGVETGCNCKAYDSSVDADSKCLEDSCKKIGIVGLFHTPGIRTHTVFPIIEAKQ